MTFEEANDRYLDILEKISHIENSVEKENMYNLASFTIGRSLSLLTLPSWRKCPSTVNSKTAEEITSFEKLLHKLYSKNK